MDSEEYERIYEAYQRKREKIYQMGGEKAVTKQKEAGKLKEQKRTTRSS